MPTYEYECTRCGHLLEAFQYIKESPLRKCPRCGRRTLKRLIGAGSGIIFKGPGFYATDHRSSGYKEKVRGEKEASKSSEGPAKGS